jgi:hypothetical protein
MVVLVLERPGGVFPEPGELEQTLEVLRHVYDDVRGLA